MVCDPKYLHGQIVPSFSLGLFTKECVVPSVILIYFLQIQVYLDFSAGTLGEALHILVSLHNFLYLYHGSFSVTLQCE
jgi:hypothetical protein